MFGMKVFLDQHERIYMYHAANSTNLRNTYLPIKHWQMWTQHYKMFQSEF